MAARPKVGNHRPVLLMLLVTEDDAQQPVRYILVLLSLRLSHGAPEVQLPDVGLCGRLLLPHVSQKGVEGRVGLPRCLACWAATY